MPVVKEWGSWAVFFSSCMAGLIAGLLRRPWATGRDFVLVTVSAILGLALLVNSKNPLASALRAKVKRGHVQWFLFFALSGLALLMPFLIEGIQTFPIFSLLVFSYAALLLLGREHNMFAELNGFALLTTAAPVVYFSVTGEMSWKLYLAVTVFFAAAVFKVRLIIKKTPFPRGLMVLYCAAALAVFHFLNVPVLLLLPFIENITTSVWMKEAKLRNTGNTELIKAVLFIILVGLFWR
ncbi:MAG: hypothetical protein C4560_10780 [Nitrospiraceae bacterium]|nr:MAG: hypothetical protein C4560_10780 [Nitrospiraceae bacterium]